MSYYAVTRNAGPAWADGKGAFEQPGAGDHAAFMNTLAEQGLVLFAGPLARSEHEHKAFPWQDPQPSDRPSYRPAASPTSPDRTASGR
jgi:hypothetical protein